MPQICFLTARDLLQAHLSSLHIGLFLYLPQKSFLKLNKGVCLINHMLFAADFEVLNKPQRESWQNSLELSSGL